VFLYKKTAVRFLLSGQCHLLALGWIKVEEQFRLRGILLGVITSSTHCFLVGVAPILPSKISNEEKSPTFEE